MMAIEIRDMPISADALATGRLGVKLTPEALIAKRERLAAAYAEIDATAAAFNAELRSAAVMNTWYIAEPVLRAVAAERGLTANSLGLYVD